MENYSYPSSAASSPRSRDLEDENPNNTNNNKVKFLCSYDGQIQPRQHDPTRLSYVGGDTKILSVDRHVTFTSFSAKLSSLSGAGRGISVKYQLPGEDLDGLISVTNDEDLLNLFAEYDRFPRPARLRIFLFPDSDSASSVNIDSINKSSENDDCINDDGNSNGGGGGSNADFLFGLDGNAEVAAKECHVIREAVGPRAYSAGAADYYQQGVPMTVPQQYWQERQVATGGLPEQPVYLIQTPSGVYQSAPLQPMTGQFPSQGYYGMQPIYNPVPQPLIQQGVFRGQAVEQGYAAYDMASRQQGVVQGQAAYDVAGRQVYYSTGVPAQGMMPQYQAVSVAVTAAAQDSGNVVVSKAI